MLDKIKLIIKTMRPRQWPKNLFVLAGLIFDGQLTNFPSLWFKRNRPLASGQLSQRTAIIATIVLFVFTFPSAFILNINFGLIITGYFLLMLAYSFWLKHIPIVDVMIIAAGFVLRVAAGVIVIVTTEFSPWLFVATTFLALFIALGKRRAEIDLLEGAADSHRQVLKGYSLELLDQLLTIVLASTLMTYCLYTFSSPITPGNHVMMLTIPFVIYGLFRYLYLIRMEHIGGAPEEIVLTDLPMQIAVGLWGLTIVIILYIL